jgi:hypothetical protein
MNVLSPITSARYDKNEREGEVKVTVLIHVIVYRKLTLWQYIVVGDLVLRTTGYVHKSVIGTFASGLCCKLLRR